MAQILTAADLTTNLTTNFATPSMDVSSAPSTSVISDAPDYIATSQSPSSAPSMTTAKPSSEYRRVRVPPHRYTPLRSNWESILTPLTTHLNLLVRFNTKTRSVELKTTPQTPAGESPEPGKASEARLLTCFFYGCCVHYLSHSPLVTGVFPLISNVPSIPPPPTALHLHLFSLPSSPRQPPKGR